MVQLQRGALVEIARLTGRSKQHIHQVLRGERRPSRELAQKIAMFLGREVSELFPDLVPPAAVESDEWEGGCDSGQEPQGE